MKSLKIIFFFVASMMLLFSCSDDDNGTSPDNESIDSKYGNGAFILNEGGHNKTNASVSYLNFSNDSIYDEIFYEINNRPLGDVLNYAVMDTGNIYLVLNASNKIEIVSKGDFSERGAISDLDNPRFATVANNKLYVSQWGENGAVKVIDLNTMLVAATIETGSGPEGIITANGKVWVANGGGYGVDSTVQVIDPATDEIIKTIQTGDNPKEFAADANGDIWVICYGAVTYDADWSIERETPSKLICISSETMEIKTELKIADTEHPQHIDISDDGKTVYFGAGFGFSGIYSVSVQSPEIPATPLIEGSFYGFNVSPENGDVYALEAPTFEEPGKLIKYADSGDKINEYSVGIGPNTVLFSN